MKRVRINLLQVTYLRNKGKSYEEIAALLGVTRDSVGRFCRKHFGLLEDRGKSTRQSISITNLLMQILFGSLLGDACIAKHNKNYRGQIIHSIKQSEYAQYLHKELNSISGKFRYIKVKVSNKVYDECLFVLRPNLNFELFYNSFYRDFNGKKDVPYNLELLTPLAIAIWFMDDGFLLNNGHSKTLGFSTCSFSIQGLSRLQLYLKETYNVETIIRKNHYLIVKRHSANILKYLIEPYIINSMKYKINLG